MNPYVMWGQVLILALPATALLALTIAAPATIVLGMALLAWWAFLNRNYAKALGVRRRPAGKAAGEPNRVALDHNVAAQALLLSIFSVAIGAAATIDGGLRLIPTVGLAVCFGGLATLGYAIYASSLVDWYYVKPRLDGLVREPPCRTSREQAWGKVTNHWYRHRAIAEAVSIVAVIVAVVGLILGLFSAGQPALAAAVAVAGVVITLLGKLPQRAGIVLRDYGIDSSRYWLGDLLEAPGQAPAFLLHVTIKGIVVRRWSAKAEKWAPERDIEFDKLADLDYESMEFHGCDQECGLLNPKCEWKWIDKSAKDRRRRLVL